MRPHPLPLVLAALLAAGVTAAPTDAPDKPDTTDKPVAASELKSAPAAGEPGDHGNAEDEKIGSYLIGFQFGQRLPETIRYMVWEDFVRGMKHAIDGADPDVEMKRGQQAMEAFQKIVEAKETKARAEAEAKRKESAKVHRAAGDKFRAEFQKLEGVKETKTGLLYQVLAEGDGDAKPGASDIVTVHYEGKLFDGTVFDSSRTRGDPAKVPLDRVLPGWTEGVQLMKKGAKYRFRLRRRGRGREDPPGFDPGLHHRALRLQGRPASDGRVRRRLPPRARPRGRARALVQGGARGSACCCSRAWQAQSPSPTPTRSSPGTRLPGSWEERSSLTGSPWAATASGPSPAWAWSSPRR
jgi:FKBP-type peptidyl-prolyl cis-trans isomerase